MRAIQGYSDVFFSVTALLSVFPNKKDSDFEYPAPELYENTVSANQ